MAKGQCQCVGHSNLDFTTWSELECYCEFLDDGETICHVCEPQTVDEGWFDDEDYYDFDEDTWTEE